MRWLAKSGLNPEQLLTEFTALHPADLPTMPSGALTEPKATTSFNKVLTLVSAVLPLIAGVLYFALPMTRGMITEDPEPSAQQRRSESMQPEVIPVGGFTESPIAAVRPVPVVVTLTISSRCQLRVVADGHEILSRTMEQGETLPIELGSELLLLGDNAAAVQFSINGQAGRQLGAAWRRPVDPHRPRRLPGFPGSILMAVGSGYADAGFFPAR